MGNIKKALLIVLILVAILAIIAIITVFSMTAGYKLNEDKLTKHDINIDVFDSNNSKLAPNLEHYAEYANISKPIIDAFISLEDKRFLSHNGLDYHRIASATLKNIGALSFKEGASTISQQLIKNTHLTGEKTVKRKLIEAKLALALEKKYSKEQILEMYLNAIYFGNGIYGIDCAARTIFNKPPSAINIEEAAMLAGIVKNPKKYSPLQNPEEALKRRDLTLRIMHDCYAITDNEYDSAIVTPIKTDYSPCKNNPYSQYYYNVIDQACMLLGVNEKELINSGVRINTYMDRTNQLEVYSKVNNAAYNPYSANQLLIMLDNARCGVTAYHANYKQALSNINRQAGSSLKPFAAYLPYLENYYGAPSDRIIDEFVDINGYSPSNYDKIYHGNVSLREALIHSHNIPAVKLLSQVGVSAAVELLRSMGISVPVNSQNLTLALGSLTVNPLQLASGYAMLANNGVFSTASFISEIYDKNGNKLYNHSPEKKKIVSAESSYMITDMLRDCAKIGTGKKLKNLPFEIAAKTGTVGDNNGDISDVWSCAYTPATTIIDWQGANNHNLPPSYGGGGYPTMIINDILTNLTAPQSTFTIPDGIINVPINKEIYDREYKAIYDPASSYYELFTNFNRPEVIVSQEIRLELVNDSLYLRAPNNTAYQLYRYGIFGSSHLIYEGETISDMTNISQLLPRSIFGNKYKLICKDCEFIIHN